MRCFGFIYYIIMGFASLLWSSLASCILHVTRLAIRWSSCMIINASWSYLHHGDQGHEGQRHLNRNEGKTVYVVEIKHAIGDLQDIRRK